MDEEFDFCDEEMTKDEEIRELRETLDIMIEQNERMKMLLGIKRMSNIMKRVYPDVVCNCYDKHLEEDPCYSEDCLEECEEVKEVVKPNRKRKKVVE